MLQKHDKKLKEDPSARGSVSALLKPLFSWYLLARKKKQMRKDHEMLLYQATTLHSMI